MKLEISLVKTKSVDTRLGKFLARARYETSTDGEVLASIEKFIGENISTFTAALTDQKLVAKLQSLSGLTISDFACLRYLLAEKGLDIWVWYVATADSNEDVSGDAVEYNVVDTCMISGSFVPFCTKFIQTLKENSMVKLYTNIQESFGLFGSSIFTDMKNPIKNMITAMNQDETVLGMVSPNKTSYVNTVLSFLGKEIYAVTD